MSSTLHKVAFTVIGLIIIATILFRGSLIFNSMKGDGPVYNIKVPDYNGGYKDYITSAYVIENGCVKFVDEYKFQQVLCEKYTITQWK